MDLHVIAKRTLIPVVPIPFHEQGAVHLEALRWLFESLVSAPIRGIALGTSSGRAPNFSDEDWKRMISSGRETLGPDRLIVGLAGSSPEFRRPIQVIESAEARAAFLAKLGVDVLVAQPPTSVRGRPERDNLILEYHAALATAGRPILLSYRREISGGIAYGPEVLAQLLARTEVIGIEIATIDGISTFQQIEALVREVAPEKLVISGEERFLGYSLMSGADAALVGIGAAYPSLVSDLIDAHFSGDAARFLRRSGEIDALARPIFRPPIDGSTQRLLRVMVELGTIPKGAGFDGLDRLKPSR